MSDAGMPEQALTAGLLMEGAQSQQQLAAAALDELRRHCAGLDAVVRDEINRTLVEGLAALDDEVVRVTRRLDSVGRQARWQTVGAALVTAVLGVLAPLTVAHWWLPTPATVAALEAQEARLTGSIARLRQQGGAAQLRRCGVPERLCVRVDPKAPRFGEDGDFAVLAGP